MNSLKPIPPIRLPMTETEFCKWLGQASPDDVLEYHRGFLALDIRVLGAGLGSKERRELGRVARRAFWAEERRLVHLVQRRHAPNDFSYLAIARHRVNSLAVWSNYE